MAAFRGHADSPYAALSLSYWAFAASALATYGALMSSGIARHSSPISLPTAPKAMPGFSLRMSGRRMAACDATNEVSIGESL